MSIVRFRDWQEPENRTMKLQESKDLRRALRRGLSWDYLTHECARRSLSFPSTRGKRLT
jgi:hypothetical protein